MLGSASIPSDAGSGPISVAQVACFDGNAWAQVPIQNGQDGVAGLLSVGPDDVFAAFGGSLIARGRSDGRFNAVVAAADGGTLPGGELEGTPNDIWSFGLLTDAIHFDGTTWAVTKGLAGDQLITGSCAGPGDCWIVGSTGNSSTLYHTEKGALVSQQGKPGAPSRVTRVWAIAKDSIIAFNDRDVYRFAAP